MWRVAAILFLAGTSVSAQVTRTVPERWAAIVEAEKQSKFFSAKRYDDLLKRLQGTAPVDNALVADMMQLFFDQMLPQQGLSAIYHDLGELKGLSPPETVEVEELTFVDGRVLPGCGGFLARLHPEQDPRLYAGQRIIDPNLGLAGIDNWWIAAEDVKTAKRIRIPLPKAVCEVPERMSVGADGRLTVSGTWARPGTSGREDIAFDLVEAGNGGCLFVNKDLALRVFVPAMEHEELWPKLTKEDRAILERWKNRETAAPAEKVPTTEEVLGDAAKHSPAIEWPEPFVPDAKSLALLKEKRKDLEDALDADATAMRFRILLTYGELPEIAKKTPKAFLDLEAKVRAFLKGGTAGKLAELDPALLSLLVRRAPDFDAPPEPGEHDGVFLRFPKNYSGWRRWPLLVVLHGQYHKPAYDFGLWSPLAEQAGMILVCPTYGSTEGTERSPKADAVVLDVVKKLRMERCIDPDRVYLTGISMGGAMSWRLSQSYPGIWAAVAPEIHGPKAVDDKFPWLRNLATTPLYVFEGEFDGLNTLNSRAAVASLRGWSAPVQYRESRWYGHNRLGWHYPAILDWMAPLARDSHPSRVEHHAFNAYEGSRAWLTIRKSATQGFGLDDGSFNPAGATGVEALYKDGVITLKKLEGKASEVEIFFDEKVMTAKEIKIEGGVKPLTWKPKRDGGLMLKRVKESGDREELYLDSIRVPLP